MNPNMSFLNNPIRYRWLMLGIMGVIYFLACLHRISPTVIARDLVNEFGANATSLGLMASAYFYLYAAVQPPVGILSDTIGPRRVVTVFTFVSCLGCLVFGLAPNMFLAGVGRGLIGIGVGGIFVPALKIFSAWYRTKEFAGITGLFLALGNAGNLSASLPLTYLVLLLGWRFSFIGLGGVSIIIGVLAWFFCGTGRRTKAGRLSLKRRLFLQSGKPLSRMVFQPVSGWELFLKIMGSG